MKKILFPTDFSKASKNAFGYALRFAAKINAEIVTIHVYDVPAATAIDYYDFLQENYDIAELGEFENYRSQAPGLRKIAERIGLGHIKISHILVQGDTVQEILRVSKEEEPDFIIMGTKGATGLQEVFLGTVAEKVINQSRIPVLAVPEGCKFAGLRKILLLAELDTLEMDALHQLRAVADIFQAAIEVLQVKAVREEHDTQLLNSWNSQFAHNPVRFSMIHSNATEDIITDYIDIHHIDAAAMVVRHKDFWQRLFLYSLSRNMAFHITIPLLSLPAR